MKKSIESLLVQLPHDRKSSYSIFGSLTALAAGLALLGGQSKAIAQSDNFNDGNDTANPVWTHNDPIKQASGGAVAGMTYTFPGGNTYHLQAVDPLGGAAGPARGGSIVGPDRTSFYVSVDVVGWDIINRPGTAAGVLARITTPGLQQTKGYSFVITASDSDCTISRIDNEAPITVSGSHSRDFPFDPAKTYRLVFQGNGANLEGRVYDIADLTTPLAVVYGNDATYSHGVSGLVVFDNTQAVGGSAAATFDNFNSAATAPDTFYSENFNDGNDTTPAPAWAHYDPLFGVTSLTPTSYTFPGGNYHIVTPAPAAPDAGQARCGSIKNVIYGSFYVSVDLIDWDDTIRQVFGIVARANNVGLQTTEGYLFSYELGGGTLPDPTGGDFDMSPLVGEVPIGQIETNSSSIHLTKGKQYRITFSGAGNFFAGRIFDLADPLVPIKTVLGTDTKSATPYTSGQVGLVVASQGSFTIGGDATFDNFFVDVAEPQLSFDGSSESAVISWPGCLTGLWVLESSSTLGPTAVWTQVPLGNASTVTTVYSPETVQSTYKATAAMTATENTFYRLRKL